MSIADLKDQEEGPGNIMVIQYRGLTTVIEISDRDAVTDEDRETVALGEAVKSYRKIFPDHPPPDASARRAVNSAYAILVKGEPRCSISR
jgi:hypothetical protein